MKIDLIRSLIRWHLKGKSLSKDKINMDNVANILIMTNTAIGDTLFATPAIQLIKDFYPDKRIIALLNPRNFKLFSTNPNIDEIITYRGRWSYFVQTIFKLNSKNIDLTFIFHSNEPQATPLAFLSGSKYIIKIPNDKNEFNFLHYNPPTARKFNEHYIDRRLKQLEFIGIKEKFYNMQLFPVKDWYSEVDKIINKQFVHIGFQIGASSKSRMWLVDSWIELANKIFNYDDSVRIVLTGSKDDKKLANEIQHSIQSHKLLNLAGSFDLCSAAALIDRLDVLVTPDTGPLHIAAAMKTPTVAISVAGNATESNPINPEIAHIFIQKPITCNPCLNIRCKNQVCMEQISADEVFEATIKIMKEL